jgi:hypothetical protein
MGFFRGLFHSDQIWAEACKASDEGNVDELDVLITNNWTLQDLDEDSFLRLVHDPIMKGYIEVLNLLIIKRNKAAFHCPLYLLLFACKDRFSENSRYRLQNQEEQLEILATEQEEQYRLKSNRTPLYYPSKPYPVVKKHHLHSKSVMPVIDFPAVVKCLLENHCDVNSTDINSKTPLHVAAYSGSIGVVDVLLTAGARIEVKDFRGETPLITAATNDNFDCVVELLKCGANTHARESVLGNNALLEARRINESRQKYRTRGNPQTAPREFQNETRSTILLALVEEDLEDLRIDRSETFVSVMKEFPFMEPEIIGKMLENTHESMHISTKNLDVDGIVRMVNTIMERSSQTRFA